jgi:hypothetical protein
VRGNESRLFVLKFYNTFFRTDRLRAEIAQATASDIGGWRGRSDQIVVVIGDVFCFGQKIVDFFIDPDEE